MCIFNSFYDQNSINAFLTLVSLVGIIIYLHDVYNSRLFWLIPFILLLAYFIQIVYGFFQATHNQWDSLSIKGQLHNSGFYGNYLASFLPLLLSMCIHTSKFSLYKKVILAIFFISAVIILIFTVARAAYIGSSMGCAFVLIFCLRYSHFKISLLKIGLIFLISLGLGIFLYILKPNSVLGRWTIYKVSLVNIKHHPLIGVGPNRFSAVYNNYQSNFLKDEKTKVSFQLIADDTFEAFNVFVQIIVEYGLIGLAILFYLIYQLIKFQSIGLVNENKKWLNVGSIGSLISIFICSLFSNPFHITPVLFFVAYHLSVVIPIFQAQISKSTEITLFKTVIYLAFTSFTVYYIITQYKAETHWRNASKVASYDSFKIAKKHYDKAYPFLKNNGSFLYNYGAEACLGGNFDLSISILEEAKKYNSYSNLYLFLGDAYLGLKQYKQSEQNYIHSIYIAPSHIYPKYKLVQLYKQWKKNKLAKMWALKALQYPIKLQTSEGSVLLKELQVEMQSGF